MPLGIWLDLDISLSRTVHDMANNIDAKSGKYQEGEVLELKNSSREERVSGIGKSPHKMPAL